MRLHKSKSATALAVILGFAASVNVQSQDTQSQPPVVVANPETKLDITPSGTPIINIAKPRDDGTSYNVFSKLNVGREGMIFNNSPKLGSTTLGGQILANPNLIRSGQSAKLILNEVIGGTRSDLNGPIEIFGPKASIIIANQSGITCDGCGFFNVERATLSSGRAVFGPNGAFSGLAVDGGAVDIAGKGLLAGNVEFFDIISASTSLNASLYARDLLIAGGKGDFDYARRTATARDGDGPRVAIDSSLLGGMYANRIRLVGNGSGVGINLRGVATALEGPLEITAQGNIAIGRAVAAGDTKISSLNSDIRISEQMFAGGNIGINAGGTIIQSGEFIAAAKNLSLKSGADISLGGTGLFAGLGGVDQNIGGSITIAAKGAFDAPQLQAIASREFSLAAKSIDFGTGSNVSATGINLAADTGLSLRGQIQSLSGLSVKGSDLDIAGTVLANALLSVDAGNLRIAGHAVGASGATLLARNDLIVSSGGSLQSGGLLNLNAGKFDNQGNITGVGATSLAARNNFDNSGTLISGNILSFDIGGAANIGGAINANDAVSLNLANHAIISGTIGSAVGLGIRAKSLDLSGTISSGGNLDVRTSDVINATASSIVATDKNLKIDAASAVLGGYVSAGDDLAISSADSLRVDGQLHAGRNIEATTGSLALGGIAVANAAVNFTVAGAASLTGIISADQGIGIKASELQTGLSAQTVASGDISAIISGDIALNGAISGRAVSLVSGTKIQNDGSIFAKADVSLSSANSIINHNIIEAEGIATLRSDVIQSDGRLVGISGAIFKGRAIDFGLNSNVQSGGTLQIDASGALNISGSMLSIGRAELRSAADFQQNATLSIGDAGGILVSGGRLVQNGAIQSGGALDFSGLAVVGSGSFFSNNDIIIRSRAGSLDLAGNLTAVGNLTFESPDFIRVGGTVETGKILKFTAKDFSIGGTVTAIGGVNGVVGNRLSVLALGQLRSGQDLVLDLTELENDGLISAKTVDIATLGNFKNSGQLVTEQATSLTIGGDFIQNGLVQAGGALSARVAGTLDANGTMFAGGQLSLESARFNAGGIIAADGALILNSLLDQNLAASSVIFGKSGVSLNSGTNITLAGQLTANGAVAVTAAGNVVASGLVESGSTVRLDATDILLSGTVKSLESLLDGISVTARNSIVTTGQLSSLNAIKLSANTLDLAAGSNIISDKDIRFDVAGAATLSGVVSTGGALNVTAASIAHSGQSLANISVALASAGDLVQSGILQSGGTMLLDAAALQLSGSTLGINDVTLIADAIDVSGTLSSNAVIRSNSGSLNVSGAITSLNGIITTVDRDLNLGSTGVIETNGPLELVAHDIDLLGRLATGNAGAKLSASGNFVSRGELLVGGNLQIDVGGAASLLGKVGANGTTSVNAVGSVSIGGELGSADAITISGRDVTIEGIISGGNAIRLSSIDGINAASTGSILAEGNIDLTSAGLIDSQAIVASGGNISLTSDSAVQLGGTLSAEANVDVRGLAIITGANALAVAGGTLSFSSVNALENAGTISAREVRLSSDTAFANGGKVFGEVDVAISANLISNTGTLVSNGTLGLDGRNISLSGTSDIQVGGALTMAANGDLETAGAILAIGGADLSGTNQFIQNATLRLGEGGGRLSTNGLLVQNGLIEANGNIALSAQSITGAGALLSSGFIGLQAGSGGIDYAGKITANLGLNFSAPSTIRLSGAVVTDGIARFDTAVLTLDGIVSANGGVETINVNALNIGSSGGLISGRDLALNYIDFNNLGTLASNGRLDITASGQAVNAGTLLAGTELHISAGGAFSNSGTLSSVNALTINSGDAMLLGGLVQSEGSISLIGGSIDVNGTLVSLGTLALSSAGDVLVTGLVSADQSAQFTARNFQIGTTGRIVGGDALTVNASSLFENRGIFAAENAINIAASSVSTLSASVLQGAHDVTIRTLGDMRLDGDLHANEALILDSGANLSLGGVVTSNAALSLLGKDIGITGTVQSDKKLSLIGETISNLGTMVGVDGVTVQATGLVNNDVSGRILSDGLIEIAGGNLQTAGLIQTGGDLEIAVGGLADLRGTLLAGNDLRVNAANISSGAIMQVGRNADINSGGNLDLASTADIVVTQALKLSSLGNFTNAGLVGSLGTIEVDAGGALQNSGSLLSNGALTLRGGSVTLSGIVNSNDVMDISANGLLVIDGTVSAQLTGALSAATIDVGALGRVAVAGNLTLSAIDLIRNAGTVVSDADISFATDGDLIIDNIVSAGGNLSFDAARDLTLAGQSFAGKLATVNARDVIVNGLLVGGPEGVEISSRSFTLGALGDIQSGGLLDITATNALVTNGQLLALGDLTLTAKNATLDGVIATHKNAKLVSESASISADITGLEGIDLSATGLLQLTDLATLASQQTIRLSGDTIATAGKISGDGAVRIDALSAYIGTGEIQSLGNIDIGSGGTLAHEGVLAAIGNIALTGGATTIAGIIDSMSDVRVTVADLTFDGQLSAKNAFIDAHDIVASQNSLLLTSEAASLLASGFAQLDGTIGATNALTIHAVGDLNLSGTAQSLNGDALVTGQNIALSGNLFSGGKVTLTAGQAFTLSGVLSAKGITDINANAIDLTSTGRLFSDDIITLRALNSITNAGEIGTGKFLDLNAAQILTNSGTLSSGAGMLLSSALVNAGGTIETSGALTLGGDIVNVTGNLLSVSALSLNSALGDIRVDGTLASLDSDVTLNAARDVFINGQASAKKVMTANGRDVVINAVLFGEDQAIVNATRNIAIGSNGVLASDGRVDIGFGGSIDLLGTISAGADLSLLTSQDLVLGGTVISGGTLTLGGRDLTLNGVVFGKDGVLANGRNLTVGISGDIQSENNLSLNATGNLAINGGVLALGNASFSATTGMQIASGANVQGRGALSFLSGGSFANAGILISENALSVNANAIDVGGSLFSGGALSLTATNTLVSSGLLSADKGDIVLNAANATLGGQIFSGESVRLRGGTALITGELTGFKGVDLEITGALSMAGPTSLIASDGLIRLAGGTITTAGTVNSNGAISILAGSAFQGGGFIGGLGVTITSNGTLNSGNIASKSAITISGLTTRITGTVESEAAVTVGGTNVTVEGSLAGAALTVNGGTITTNIGSTLLSGGAINFAATGAISTAGSIESIGNITFGAGTTLTQNGTLRSSGNIDLTSGGLLTSNGATEAVGTLKLRGGSITTGGALLSNGALSLTSLSGDIAVNAAISSAAAVAINSSRDVNLNAIVFGETGGSLSAQRNFALAANGGLITDAGLVVNAQNLTNAGVLSAGIGGMTANFSGSVVNSGFLLSGGGLTLTSGGFSSTNAIQAAGPITLTAANATISGQVGSDTNVTIRTTAGALNVNGDVFGRIVNLDAVGGNLQLGTNSFVQAQTSAKLTSSVNAIIDGDILSNGLVEILANNGALNTGANASIRTGGAVSLSAKNALTHLGSVEAVGNITLTGGNISSNILFSDGAINLTATGPIVINGETSARNVVDIKSTGSTLTINSAGLVRSQIADVKLSSTQALRNDGIIVGQTGVNASAGGSVLTNNGQIIANGGTLALTANQLDLGGTVFGNNLVNLNGAAINVTGNIGAETSLSVTGGNLTIGTTGLLQSNGGASLTTSGLTVNGTLRTFLGNLVVSGTTLNVNNGGRVESGGTLNMTATGTLANNGQIVSGGALALSGNVLNLGGVTSSGATASFGGGALNISGLVETRGQLTINNGAVNLTNPSAILRSLEGIGITTSTLTNAGSIEAAQPISINASAALSSSGTIISNQGLTLQTGGLATLGGNIISGGALSVTGATINQSGLISAINDLSLTANSGGITVGGALVGQKAITLSATGQTIIFNPTAEVFGKDSVSVSASNITNSGKILSPGTVTLNAANVLTQNGQLVAGGLANLTGGSKIDLGGQLDAGAVTLNAPIINVTGSLVANGAVTMNANNAVTVSGSLAGGSIALNGSGTDFRITAPGRVVSGGNVALTGLKNLTVEGLLSAADNLTATYSGVANVSGRIEAGDDIILTSTAPSGQISGATLIVPGQIIAGRDLSIIGGATVISGTVYGDRNVNISTASYFVDSSNFAHSLDVTGAGKLASGGNLNVNIIGDLNVVGPNASIQSGGNAILAALTHNISGQVIANGMVQFTNRGDLASGPVAVASDGFNLTGSGTVQSGGRLDINTGPNRDVQMNAGTSLISNDRVIVSGRDIDSLGTVAAANLVNFTGTGGITFGGLVQSGNRISAHAGDVLATLTGARIETIGNSVDVAISRNQGGNANIDLFAGNVLTNSGTIFSDGSVFLGTNNALTNLGTITGLFSVIAQSNNDDIENLGTMTGGTLAIFQNSAFHNTGTYVAANNLLIDAPEIFNSGLIGAGNNLTLQSGSSITNTGTLFAGNNLTLSAGTRVHNDDGTILAAFGSIAITAAELINDSARIESLNGNVTINSGNVVNRIKDLVIVGGGGVIDEGYYRTDLTGTVIVGGGPQEFNPQDCGTTIGGLPIGSTITCESVGGFIASYTVHQSFVSQITGITYSAGFYNFFPSTPATGAITANTGPSQIVAAGNVTINGGTNGVVTNRNSSILAGGNISITTGILNNESTTVQTATGEVLLPAIIRAGGTVSIVANQINNGTVQNNGGFTGGPNDTFNTSQGPGASGQGGMGSAAGPGGQNAGLNGSAGPANGPGSRNGSANGNFAVGNGPGGSRVSNNGNAGTGAGNVAGPNGGGFGPANGNAGNAGGVSNGPSAVNGVGGVSDGSVAAGVGGLPNGNGGFDGGSISNGAPVGNQGAVNAAGFNVNAVVLQPVNAGTVPGGGGAAGQAANANGAVINGPGNVGSTGPSGVQANVGPTDGLTNVAPGGGTGGGAAVGSAPTSVAGSTTTAQLVDGFDGQVVGITSVGTTSATTAADSSLNGAATPDGAQQGDLANINAVGGPQAAATSTNGQASATASLLDGFNGIAIPGIIGANGDAGSFVFDFLRQFDLIGGANGSLSFANGDGLFTFNDSPDADFLFSTNRGFDEIGGLFDSDYFFDQLDIDRGTHFTRLGDGFFESQLIGQQVRAATQQAQLPQFGTALAQAEGLMASAVKQQKGLNLSVGVALTASQVSALTESLVWWVSAKVNGRDVLVPVVYLAKNDQKSITNGALIAGTNVVANVAGNITNSGTISGANLVSLTAGNDFINMAGGLVTGGTVGITAGNDILNNAGAAITGGDIFLTAGRDIMMSSTIDTSTSSTRENLGRNRFTSETTTTQVATGSTIAATGNLVMNAGRDISISFGNVSAGGDAAMVAGRDVLITGVTTTDTQEAAWKTGKYKHGTSSSSEETFHGSVIKVGGDLGISAGRDPSTGSGGTISIIGSAIKVGDDLSMQAGGGITIAAAETHSSESLDERLSKKIRVNQLDATATTHVLADISAGGNIGISTPGAFTVAGATIAAGDPSTGSGGALLAINAGSVSITGVMDEVTQDTKRVVKSGGMLSSKKTTTVTSMVDQSVIGSTLEGDRVSITSLGDISIKGSNVVATGNLAINAGGMIDIGTMVEEDSSFSSVKVKKSGFSMSGGGLFMGVAKTRNDTSLETSTNVGSLIGSATGNVTLNAEGALKITGSDVVAPGTVNLIGDSVTIAHAIDTATSTSLSKSSSFGVSVKAQSSIVDTIKTVSDMATIAAGTESSRVAAVSLMAGGLAIKNGIDAGKDIADAIKSGNGNLGITLSASLGFSKSKATSEGTDQTVVGSNISGGNVNIVATGSGDAGFVRVTGSDIVAANNLVVLGNGPITFEAATETDTNSGKSSSFGASIGVSAKVGLEKGKLDTGMPSVNFGMSSSKSSFSSTDVTNREATLSAGGTAMIGTPGALVIDGAIVSGGRVDIDAGSLAIISRQDTSSFRSNESSMGINVSVTMSGQVSASGNMSSGRQVGEFASVAEQAGIFAGAGGFDINVTGNTDLKGGVIASTAAPDLNRLVTGTLTFSDIENVERYKASNLSMGAGIGANLGQDRKGDINTDGSGNPLPGFATPIGTISATVPIALSASGSQNSTTHSAIAPGAIVISSGDAASQIAADTISRDVANANDALEKEFTAEKREEIQQGFTAVKQLVVEVSTYFANRAADQKAKEDEAEAAKKERDKYPPDSDEYKYYEQKRQDAATEAKTIKDTYGAGSPIRLIATALTAAAGGNVSGGMGSFIQSAAVNVLQGLAAEKVKELVDGFTGSDGERETLRAALHAVVGCAGAAAGGGDCASGATGAAASVVLSALLSSVMEEDPTLTLEEQQARTNLAATLIGAIAAGAGLDPGSAVTAVQIEMENNDLTTDKGIQVPTAPTGGYTVAEAREKIAELKSKANLTDEEKALLVSLSTSYGALIAQYGTEEAAQRAVDADVALEKSTKSDAAFAGGPDELKEFFLNGGTLEDLRADKKAYLDAYVASSIDNFDLTDEQKQALQAEYAAGAKASDIYLKAYEQSVGPINAAIGKFGSENRSEIEQLQFLVDLLPTSRVAVIVTAGTDVATSEHGQNEIGKIFSTGEIAENAAIMAVIAQRQARQSPDVDDPGGYRIETINGKKVFVGKPPLDDPKAGVNPEFNDPKHKVGFDGEVRLAQEIQAKVPGQVVISYGNGAGVQGADVVTVDADGNVYLYDNRVRNSGANGSGVPKTTIQDSSALYPKEVGKKSAITQAIDDIEASNLPKHIKELAKAKLSDGTYFAITVGDGTGARNSAVQKYVDGVATNPNKVTTKPSGTSKPKGF